MFQWPQKALDFRMLLSRPYAPRLLKSSTQTRSKKPEADDVATPKLENNKGTV